MGSEKIQSRQRTIEDAREARERGLKLVFTNGCFDLLHPGHFQLLIAARRLGDRLYVALNSDASVKALKGEGRPLYGEMDRAFMLACLEPVDVVTIFAESTPLCLIEALRPDVLVKADHYDLDAVVGAEAVRSWGGIVARVPTRAGHSTTAASQAWFHWIEE